jgi:hypothetical protein
MDSAPLPQGTDAQIVNGKDNAESTNEFKKMVEKSKEKLHAETSLPPKRGRGRPRKVVSDAPAPTAAPSMAPPPLQATDITRYLIPPIGALSKIPANKHQIPELALSPDEAGMCAMACNDLLNVFVPDLSRMSPKTAAIISAGCTFSSIFFTKYQIYSTKMAERKASVKKPESKSEQTAAAESPFPVTHVDGGQNFEPYRTRQ